MTTTLFGNTGNLDTPEAAYTEKVVLIRRVAKVVKGGRRLSFNVLVVVGDGQGRVGMGLGKAIAVPDAVRKGNAIARRNMLTVPLEGTTIPHPVRTKYGAAVVFIKPARPGSGIIAGGGVRAVMEATGITDVVTKSLGSPNAINVVKVTLKALAELRSPQQELDRRHRTAEALPSPLEEGNP